MKNIKYILLYVLSFTFVFWSCDSEDDLVEEINNENPLPPEEPDPTVSSGNADFTTYVAIGNSLTAGLMDGALYNRGQQNSFANLLGQRFEAAGGGAFDLPSINSDNGFNTTFNDLANAFDPAAATFGKLVLDLSIPGPVPTTPGDPLNMIDASERPNIDNLGVPGMRMVELTVNGYGTLNPFYTRFALDPNTTSVLEQALARNPSFITLWLGGQDVLAWSTTGGTGPDGQDESGNPTGDDTNPNALVSEFSFTQSLQGSLQAMFATNPDLQGVILNVPNITLLPFFQAVQWDAIPLDEATAAGTNAAYAGYNDFINTLANPAGPFGQAISDEEALARQISFSAGDNAVVVDDDQLTDITPFVDGAFAAGQISEAERAGLLGLKQARQLKSVAGDPTLANFGLPAEIITLSAGSVLGELADPDNPQSVIGVGVPLGDEYTLTTDEIANVVTRLSTFNGIIAAEVAKYPNLHLYDANALFTSIAAGGGYTVESGFTYAPDFSPNGVFSVDGIHPNPAGNAIIANEIMELIETEFNAELPAYDPTEFSTVISAQ